MSNPNGVFRDLDALVAHFRATIKPKKPILIYAYNGVGKTRLSMAFKDAGRIEEDRDTLYFNAFTEDLFTWDNDLDNDEERYLRINRDSRFFDGLQGLEMENRIRPLLHRYVDFDFIIDYEKWTVVFNREILVEGITKTISHIKVSRGEENIFVWCFFMAIAQLAVDRQGTYNWVKHIYVDDPISSLDENNAIAVACDLAQLLNGIEKEDGITAVISTHHSLFFNVMYYELKKPRCYFLHANGNRGYALLDTRETPFFHHVAMLSELQQVANSGKIYTYHFNALRSILEKTARFFGLSRFASCIHGVDDEVLFSRAVNLLSHGKYSLYEPKEMGEDNKQLFRRILNAFLDKYQFQLPELIIEEV